MRNLPRTSVEYFAYSLRASVSQRLLRHGYKSNHTVTLLGCSIAFFKQYIEKQFKKGMTWNNRGNSDGKWQIHHIKPCRLFDLTKSEEQLKCFYYKNCIPVWYEKHKQIHKQLAA